MKTDDWQKDTYEYKNYFKQFSGAKLNIVSRTSVMNDYGSQNSQPYSEAIIMADAFKKDAQDAQSGSDFDDFFNHKVELSNDKITLILNEMSDRGRLKNDNLKSLYEDLQRINCWRLQRPYPLSYMMDQIWSDLNKSELQVREQIRRELKDSAKDLSFPQKDLRESLLEFKLQNQKSKMMDFGGLDDLLVPDGQKNMERDIYYIPNPTQYASQEKMAQPNLY